ncbi:NAD+ synthase [Methanobrevibacter sp. TMH8]|uniref:NAD+ synthase n=1 Tax=Methanobrevibacter sp. TMH8 TaxID=2848611 RepID=UPI001CCE0C60|nr:NAD+ synthase [Methanobrevibacter sp. TMH8]MBZ9571107.1 NAD+ synthase [Methanobrevibacter sp. TMH8]
MKLPEIDPKKTKIELINFIKEMTNETNVDGVVIGLSGGIDSTVVAYLLKEAIGSENIYSYHLASSTTPKEDTEHARLVAKLLNLDYKEINIDKISDEFLTLAKNLNNTLANNDFKSNNKNKAAEGNLKARIRMSLLYYFANLKNCLVAGTGNKSELLIGYFTKFGDGACDFELIGDIYKTQLRKLAKSWEIPDEIINKPPRAGLWKNQTDEDEIGFSYEILDQLLYLIHDKKLENDEILKKTNNTVLEINNIRTKIANNKHKLYSPPSPFENKKLF